MLETKDYISEANQQLNVTPHYKKLPDDPTVTQNKLINDAIGTTDIKKTAETLKTKNPDARNFNCYRKCIKPRILDNQLLVL